MSRHFCFALRSTAPSPPCPHYVFPGIGPLVFVQKNSKYPTKNIPTSTRASSLHRIQAAIPVQLLGKKEQPSLSSYFSSLKGTHFSSFSYILPIFLGRGMPILLVFCYSVLGIDHCLFSVKTEGCICVGMLVIHPST